MIILIASRAEKGAEKAAWQFVPDLDVSTIEAGCAFEYTFESKYLGPGKQATCQFLAQEHTAVSLKLWAADLQNETLKTLAGDLAAFIYIYDNVRGDCVELQQIKTLLDNANWTGAFIVVPLTGLDKCKDSDLNYFVEHEIGVVDFGDLVESCLVAVSELDQDSADPPQRPCKRGLVISQPSSESSTKPRLGNMADNGLVVSDGPSSHQSLFAKEVHAEDLGNDSEDLDTLTQVYQELLKARDSDMTNEEKLQLAETLARRLVP